MSYLDLGCIHERRASRLAWNRCGYRLRAGRRRLVDPRLDGHLLVRVLIASSPHHDDPHAVGSVIDALVDNAAGEVITLYLAHSGGACEIAYQLVHDQVDAGLDVHFWLGESVDRVFVWSDGQTAPPVTIPAWAGPVTIFGNVLSREPT